MALLFGRYRCIIHMRQCRIIPASYYTCNIHYKVFCQVTLNSMQTASVRALHWCSSLLNNGQDAAEIRNDAYAA
jgi:hypothetical protein